MSATCEVDGNEVLLRAFISFCYFILHALKYLLCAILVSSFLSIFCLGCMVIHVIRSRVSHSDHPVTIPSVLRYFLSSRTRQTHVRGIKRPKCTEIVGDNFTIGERSTVYGVEETQGEPPIDT